MCMGVVSDEMKHVLLSFLPCYDASANVYIDTIVSEYLVVYLVRVETCNLRL